VSDVAIRRISLAGTLVLAGAFVGGAYLSDRAYRRWWKANHPFAASKARIRRAGTTYRETRSDVGEGMQIAAELLGVVADVVQQVRSAERP
jgi:hypothetical protein